MVVNLLGNPNDFDVINDIVKFQNLWEQNTSWYFWVHSHHMATMEGGFVVTDDEELYHILLSLRAHGIYLDIM